MTDRPLSPQDIEELSAYLDNQLSADEGKRLEARLAANAGMRTAFEDLRRTRHMVRTLPRVRAPRNFTLSAKLAAEIRPPKRSFWQLSSSWGMVSAMTSLLLMITLMGDFLGAFTPPPMVASSGQAEAVSLTMQMQALDEPSGEPTQPAMVMMLPPTTLSPEEAETQEALVETQADPMATPEDNARSMMTPAPKEGAGEEISPDATAMATTLAAPPPPLYTPPWVHLVETALLGLAVGAASLALFFLRRNT